MVDRLKDYSRLTGQPYIRKSLARYPYPLPDEPLPLSRTTSRVASLVAAIACPIPVVLVAATRCHRPLAPFTAVGRSTRSNDWCCCPKAVPGKEVLTSSEGASLEPLCCR